MFLEFIGAGIDLLSFFSATLTVKGLVDPVRVIPFKALIAFWASVDDSYLTKPTPLETSAGLSVPFFSFNSTF